VREGVFWLKTLLQMNIVEKGVEALGNKGFGVVGVNSKDFYKETPD